MKRIVLLTLIFLPMLASADAIEIGGIYYNLTKETKEAEVASNPNKYSGSITIPESVEYEGVTYSVTAISRRAFYNCLRMADITIPNSVTKIGNEAFFGCYDLWHVTIPDKVTTIEDGTFGECFTLRLVYIPEGVTTIGADAFFRCWHMTSVIIPSSVTFIDGRAFADCERLKDVYCYAENVPNIQDNPFQGTEIANVTLHVPAASVSAYQAVEPWKNFKEIAALTDLDEYHPLLEEGKVWIYGYNDGVYPYMKRLTIGSDTIIGNQTYKKIVEYRSSNPQTFEMLLREEGRKVYCYYPNQNSETLLYDFGKNAGEIISREIKNGDTWIRKVIDVDTVMYKAKLFRCMTVHEYVIPDYMSEEEYFAGNYGYDSGFWVEGIGSFSYLDTPITYPGNYYSFHSYTLDGMSFKQQDILDAIKYKAQNTYHPFVEEGKVWKVGILTSGNPVLLVDHYYFDGDTIINGKTCKQMVCKRYVTPDFAKFINISQDPPLCYMGAWYEENKKVYFCNTTDQQFKLMYDFSVNANDTLQINNLSYVIGPKQAGDLKGFKGVYRDVRLWADGESIYSVPWLERVGGTDAPTTNVYPGYVDPMWVLMSCTVGDEVIYLNDEYEDGATPESMGARKRFDFSHTIKTKPKARNRSEENLSLYGEYNDQQLGINLNPLDDAYLVSISDETGKVVYEKSVNAGNIVGLNIDISAYAKGHYTITVENSDEIFTGEFDAQATEIRDVRWKKEDGRSIIYNLQGQRLHSLQKGLNIVNGQKVFVK